jgi:hypothetical protein
MTERHGEILMPQGLLGAFLSAPLSGNSSLSATAPNEAGGWGYWPSPQPTSSDIYGDVLDLPQVISRPDRVTVPRGMTVERLARNIYGDDWRAGR